MSKFHVGQKVVKKTDWICLNSEWKGRPIHKGEVHEVRGFDISPRGNRFLLFVGIHNGLNAHGEEYGYAEKEYAPIIESSTEFVEVTFTKIVESTPKICAS